MPRRPGDDAPRPAVTLPEVVLARDAPSDAVRRAARAGEVERVGRGVYLEPVADPERHPLEETVRRALAHASGTHRRLEAGHVFSHATAALLWGLPLWRIPVRTSVLVSSSAGAFSDRRIVRRTGLTADIDVVMRNGMPVTSLERTLVDCAQLLPPLDGLVVADAALRAGADVIAVAALLRARAGRRGIARAREVVALADPGAESPGETATRFTLLRDGWPAPTTQIEVATRRGTFWLDLGFPSGRLGFEYDGRGKYDDPDELVREKRRQDAVVEAGWRLLRVTKDDDWSDLTPRALAALPRGSRVELTPRPMLQTPFRRDREFWSSPSVQTD